MVRRGVVVPEHATQPGQSLCLTRMQHVSALNLIFVFNRSVKIRGRATADYTLMGAALVAREGQT
jgi:hypothetical protein